MSPAHEPGPRARPKSPAHEPRPENAPVETPELFLWSERRNPPGAARGEEIGRGAARSQRSPQVSEDVF